MACDWHHALTGNGRELGSQFGRYLGQAVVSQSDCLKVHSLHEEEHGVQELPEITRVQPELVGSLRFLTVRGDSGCLLCHGL